MILYPDRTYRLSDLPKIAAVITPLIQGYKIIGLSGPMGAGKTTLIRSICEQLGVRESVRSPSYTWVNQYTCLGGRVYHFDFYRLLPSQSGQSLDPALIRDHTNFIDCVQEANSISFVEWHSALGDTILADYSSVIIQLDYCHDDDDVGQSRLLRVSTD